MTGSGVWSVKRGKSGYPAALLDLGELAPDILYGCGDREALASLEPAEAVTIVGARRATAYGVEVAERMGRELASCGVTVVSGMAYGIDSAALRGAVDEAGRAIAVLGGGPDHVYPATARRLYKRIVETGAAISEWPSGTRPHARYFPRRNRIMAALGGMTVVVEAMRPSGSLITAEQANGLGRTVGAVPGSVTSALSDGTNHLLFDGAAVVRDAQDVLDQLLGVGRRSVRRSGPPLEQRLLRLLSLLEGGATTCDAITVASGFDPREVAVALSRLELLGYVRGDGGRYVRTALAPP
jgi:DNA processing protein